MKAPLEHSVEEIKRLRRCINDLVSVVALPATWSGGEPSQIVRTLFNVLLGMLNQCLGCDSQKWPPSVRSRIGDADISIAPFRLGLWGGAGVIVAGSQRQDFPGQTERLLLNVAANQAGIWLQETRLLSEQKRVARHWRRARSISCRNLSTRMCCCTRSAMPSILWAIGKRRYHD